MVDHDFARTRSGICGRRTLLVYFLKPVAGLSAANIRIEGGVRVKQIDVLWAYPANAIPAALVRPEEKPYYLSLLKPDHVLVVRTDIYGDFSRYRLRLVTGPTDSTLPEAFDPQLSSDEFWFKVECASDFDCMTVQECPPEQFEAPEIDTLAKDYDSFRRLMLDRMSLLMPDWQERNPADVQIALMEILAYVADHLSYYQDAVATEAYLGTARRRTSLRRHVRLLDYRPHEGANARAWIVFEVKQQVAIDLSKGPVRLLSRGLGGPVIPPASQQERDALQEDPLIFELMHDATLYPANYEIRFYTWGDAELLPAGWQHARHIGGQDPQVIIQKGDILVFEEVRSPTTGAEADADPTHRHAVRLIDVTPVTDEANGDKKGYRNRVAPSGRPAVFALHLGVGAPRRQRRAGERHQRRARQCAAGRSRRHRGWANRSFPTRFRRTGRYRPHLSQGPLVFAGAAFDPSDPGSPATAAMSGDPRQALPAIWLSGEGSSAGKHVLTCSTATDSRPALWSRWKRIALPTCVLAMISLDTSRRRVRSLLPPIAWAAGRAATWAPMPSLAS